MNDDILMQYSKRWLQQHRNDILQKIAIKCVESLDWNEFYYFAWLGTMGMCETMDIIYD